MTLEKKIALGDVVKIVGLVFGIGVFYADAKASHEEIAKLSVKFDAMNGTVQTQALTIQKLSDALDHLQNPNAVGPAPARYIYIEPAKPGHSSAPKPTRTQVLEGN